MHPHVKNTNTSQTQIAYLHPLLVPQCDIVFLIRVPEYVKKYATEEALREHDELSTSSESSMSDFSEDEVGDMEL